MTTYVLSGGGHARVVIAALKANGIAVDGITDRDNALKGTRLDGVPVLGTDEYLFSLPVKGIELYIGLGNIARRDASGLSVRRRLFERFLEHGFAFPSLIASRAVVASSAEIGAGVQVMEGSVVQAGAHICENALVNTGAIVEHDCWIGGHCHIAPGAILCGGVRLGEECHVGAGAIVLQGISIPDGAVIPAGTVVRR